MKKIDIDKILLIVFLVLFGLSVVGDGLILYDYFDPCRIDMNKCGDSFVFNLVHSNVFRKALALENLFNIVVSGFIIYRSFLKKKYVFIVLGIVSLFTTFSLWLLLMGELGIIFS